jgi:hypothetical protein
MIQNLKFKISNLKFKIVLGIFIFSILLTPHFILPAQATDSTPSADIQSKLKILEQEIASKAAKLKNQINQKLQNRVYLGVVKSKTTNTITLATKTETKMVNISQDTKYYSDDPAIKKYGLANLKPEDLIAALGDVDDTGVLTAREIDLEPTQPAAKKILWGKVTGINEDLLTIQDASSKNYSVSLKSLDQTVKLNSYVILTGLMNKESVLEAGFLYPVTKNATSSASPSPKPSASSKVSPKPSASVKK